MKNWIKLFTIVSFLGILMHHNQAFGQLHLSSDTTFFSMRMGANMQLPDTILIGSGTASEILPTGAFYYVDNDLHVLRHFAPKGKFVNQYGREGRGPGEFKDVVSMDLSGDTLYLLDFQNARIVTFDIVAKNFGEIIDLGMVPSRNTELIIYNDQILILGSFPDKYQFVHVFDMNGKYRESYGDFIDYSNFMMNANGKSQITQLHAAPDLENNILFTIAAPYTTIYLTPERDTIWTHTDPKLPKPWVDHIKVTPTSYQAKFYPQTYNSVVISNDRYVVYWIDPNKRECFIDLRDLSNGALVKRSQLDFQLAPIQFERANDEEFYMLMKSRRSNDLIMTRLQIKKEYRFSRVQG